MPSAVGFVLKAKKCTVFGQKVDDCVRLTVAVEVSQLRAAVHSHVVDPEAPLTAAARVQHGTLQHIGEYISDLDSTNSI